jgi:hypothetical protein
MTKGSGFVPVAIPIGVPIAIPITIPIAIGMGLRALVLDGIFVVT